MLGFFRSKQSAKNSSALDLRIQLPPCNQKQDKALDIRPLIQKISAPDLNPVYLLVAVKDYFTKLNRVVIKPENRYEILEQCLPYVSVAARKVYIEFQKTPALPESAKRRESLMGAVLCLKEVSVCIKRLLKNDLNSSGRNYKNARRRIVTTAINYFEVLLAEQRLMALRYQVWPAPIWSECNQFYYAMAAIGDVTTSQKTLPWFYGQTAGGEKQPAVSIQELYLLIQLFGFMDATTLSVQQIQVLDHNNRIWVDELQVIADRDMELGQGQLVVYRNLDKPALLDRTGGQYEQPLILDLTSLLQKLKLNYDLCMNKLNGSSQSLANKNFDAYAVTDREDIERLLALKAMLDRFLIRQRNDTRHYREDIPVYVYIGYSACFTLLSSSRELHAQHAGERILQEALAKSSAPISQTSNSGESARWVMINEGNKGMLLQTNATHYISTMFVGQLLAISESSEGLQTPTLAYVTRIRRLKENCLQVALAAFSAQTDCVVVQNAFLAKNDMGLPGLLVFDLGEQLRLLMHQSQRLSEGAEVTIKRGSEKFHCVVEDTQIMQREFFIYKLSTANHDTDSDTDTDTDTEIDTDTGKRQVLELKALDADAGLELEDSNATAAVESNAVEADQTPRPRSNNTDSGLTLKELDED